MLGMRLRATAGLGSAAAVLAAAVFTIQASTLPHLPATSSPILALVDLKPHPVEPLTSGTPSLQPLVLGTPVTSGVKPPVVHAASAVLFDLDTGTEIWELNSHARRAPASLTKVITTLVALQAMGLDQEVTVPASIRQLPWDSTLMGLTPGEQLTVRELAYGLFLKSGNDAAITLAEAAMPRAAFVEAMNAEAARLGLADSHFVNPVGLDAGGHYSSAADLATATLYLERNYPQLASIAATRQIVLPKTATHKAFHLWNLNRLLFSYPGANGLKTGYTGRAGGCLIETASRNGQRLLAVVLGSNRVFDDAKAVLNYGFALLGPAG
jgi:D-alanyl-D-alanine carboxypeptidase (penicillin-binding protein 5/6)